MRLSRLGSRLKWLNVVKTMPRSLIRSVQQMRFSLYKQLYKLPYVCIVTRMYNLTAEQRREPEEESSQEKKKPGMCDASNPPLIHPQLHVHFSCTISSHESSRTSEGSIRPFVSFPDKAAWTTKVPAGLSWPDWGPDWVTGPLCRVPAVFRPTNCLSRACWARF